MAFDGLACDEHVYQFASHSRCPRRRDRCLAVTWKGGIESIVDVAKPIADYAIFAPLRSDDELIRSVTIGEYSWPAHWPNDMEISADTLWRLAVEQRAA
jgi:Protein of unknown function (DUF2442)